MFKDNTQNKPLLKKIEYYIAVGILSLSALALVSVIVYVMYMYTEALIFGSVVIFCLLFTWAAQIVIEN